MLTHQVFAVANLVKVCLSIRQCKSSGNHIKLNPSACSLVSGLCFRSVRLSVRSMGLESCGEKTGISYFLTSMGGNCFRNVGNCKHTSSVGRGWSSGSQTPLTSRYFLFRSRFYPVLSELPSRHLFLGPPLRVT